METIVIDKSLLDIMKSSMKAADIQYKEVEKKLIQSRDTMAAALHAMKLQNDLLEEAHAKIQTLETMLKAKK
jgi:hypothetical protein